MPVVCSDIVKRGYHRSLAQMGKDAHEAQGVSMAHGRHFGALR